MGTQKRRKVCPHCKHEIKVGDQFCSTCGREARQGAGKRTRIRKKQSWQWVIVSVLFAGVLMILYLSSTTAGNKRFAYSERSAPLVQSIVSAFDCSCGKCILALNNCECPTAQETIDYIAQAVADGKRTRKEIVRMVNDRYGHLIDRSELQS